MADYSNFKVSNLYQGGYSSFNPGYGSIFTGYRASASAIGMATDPRTADILTDISQKIAPGVKTVEVSMVSPEIFESVPQHHLKEVNRLAKLTGVDITVHAPVVEPSGMSREGFSEANRSNVERQMNMAVERSHEMNPDGSFPVTFHSSGILPAPEVEKTKEGEEVTQRMLVINQETGQINAVKRETKHYPYPEKLRGYDEEGKLVEEKYDVSKGITYSAEKEVQVINHSEWDNDLSQAVFYKDRADRLLDENFPLLQEIWPQLLQTQDPSKVLTPTQYEVYNKVKNSQEYLKHIHLTVNSLFNKAYKYSSPEDQKKLKIIADKYGQLMGYSPDPKIQSQALQEVINHLQDFQPDVYKPLHSFAKEKTAETFANVALNAYDKFGDKAPIISIENPPAGGAISRGSELKELVEKSRENFVKKATEEGMSKSEAKRAAEKLIGVTWDVGHINMIRKFGFSEEDVVKESEKVAPYVKHVHLSDNFGFEHTELPMGMGNVPFKEIMGKLGKKGFEAKKIIEAANWWQHFKTPPFQESIQAMSSPIYPMKQPYWNQGLGLKQDYFSGYGEMLPQVHFETFGGGFSGLPMELGGQMQGGRSRVSGRPME